MNSEKIAITIEIHLALAKQTNGRVWTLLEKDERTTAENIEMESAAHASLYHWLYAGAEIHRQRAEWLLARVYTVLQSPKAALTHARRCLELTKLHPEQMTDFDIGYAYEGAARAAALVGDLEKGQKFYARAVSAGKKIAGEEDRAYFTADLEGGEWFELNQGTA